MYFLPQHTKKLSNKGTLNKKAIETAFTRYIWSLAQVSFPPPLLPLAISLPVLASLCVPSLSYKGVSRRVQGCLSLLGDSF